MVRKDLSGKVSIVLSGTIGLAAILFSLYVSVNMPESGVQNPPQVGTPLLYIGILIVSVILIIAIAKAAS